MLWKLRRRLWSAGALIRCRGCRPFLFLGRQSPALGLCCALRVSPRELLRLLPLELCARLSRLAAADDFGIDAQNRAVDD
jgi:hypothetical protein